MDREQALSWIREFIHTIDTQDNRITAGPIQFLLQQKREYVAHDEYNHQTETIYRHHDMESTSCKTYEEAVQWLKEYGYKDDKLEKEIEHIEKFEMGHYWETSQSFMTEQGVKRHLELNRHNLGDHRDYVVHAFRNPEMRELFEALRALIQPTPDTSTEKGEI